MSRFLSRLAGNLAALPKHLQQGLAPRSAESEIPARRMRRSFVFHLHPAQVTDRALLGSATLGLGIITLTLFAVLAVTGVLLMLYYVPTPEKALFTTRDIQHAVAFGGLVRALHRWAAHGMVLTAFLHLLRVCLTGAYIRREQNFLIGVGLLLLTLCLAFTGYLLPWDQLSYWAVTVSANLLDHIPLAGPVLKRLLLGGDSVGGPALVRFYTLHVALLPGLLFVFIIFHLWRLRKDGGLARPVTSRSPEMLPAWPHLVLREAVVALAALTAVALVALAVEAPLGASPDVHHPSNPEKTPWYFLFLQEMVSYSAPLGGFVFPGALLLGLLLLPFLDRGEAHAGLWLGAPRERAAFVVSLVSGAAVFAILEAAFLGLGMTAWLAAASPLVRDLVNPAAGMMLVSVVSFFAGGALTGTIRGAVLSALAVVLVAMAGFTFMGVCRGPGWIFYWPFEAWPDV
jgi:quinol-cytochrome oxidoreductase complex cytochrome b subunit